MRRRAYLATLAAAGVAGTAGCGTVRSETTLSDPDVRGESGQRRSLQFTADGQEVGSLGVDGTVSDGRIELSTEIWHREATRVRSVELGVWMPPASASPAEVAVVSPVQGDSSPPPSVSLSTPRDRPGTVIEIDDFDDLADETISTLDLAVTPGSTTATTLVIDGTIELNSTAPLDGGYELDGRLELEFPALEDQ